MSTEIKFKFTEALTPETQEAIRKCPGFRDAVQKATVEPHWVWKVRKYTGCSAWRECDAVVSFTPSSGRLTIGGHCPKLNDGVLKTPG